MGKLSKFNEHTFYGIAAPPQVQGLAGEIRYSERGGQRYAYIIYRDASGIKWRIMPSIVATSGKISALRLYHRNSEGGRGFHSQGQTVWGTHEGLRDLIAYIRNHEEYEASGRLDDHLRQRTEEVRHALRNLPETLLRETILSW